MASPLLDLPDELLQDILLKLPKKDIKTARLTCTQLAGNGAHHMFKRIYFAPRKKVMRDFKCITSNPVFGQSVEELVYDARHFVGYDFHEGDPSECTMGCTQNPMPVKRCGWEAMRVDRNWSKDLIQRGRNYNGFYVDQQAILESGDDFQLLREGLHRMPRTSKLTLRDDFQSEFESFPRAHDWYVRRSSEEFGISVHPSYCISTNDPSQAEDVHNCDVRGVAGLYKALASANVKLLNFCAGFPVTAVLPPQFFTIPLFPGPSLSHQLTTVEIDIDSMPYLSRTAVQSQQHPSDMVLSSFPDFLSSSKLLECLGIRGNGYCWFMLPITFVEGLQWPQLRILELSCVTVSCDELENLVSMHRESLRELTMHGVHLSNGKTRVVNWDEITKELGECLTLNVVSLVRLVDIPEDVGIPMYLRAEDHKGVAGNLMGQCSYTVNLEEVDGAHIAIARRT